MANGQVHTDPPKRLDEFVEFWPWFFHTTKLRFKFVGWTAVIVPILAVTYYGTGILKNFGIHLPLSAPSPDFAIRISYLAQVGVVFIVLLLYTMFVDVAKIERFEYGTEGQRRLRFWWSIALLSFLFLYIFLWVRTYTFGPLVDAWLGTLPNLFNNFSTFAFLMCFSAMEFPAKRDNGTSHEWIMGWIAWLALITFIEVAVRIGFASSVSGWTTDWFGLLAGTTCGIALAMFCGRLSSPLINPQISVMVLLYLYAVVQVSFGLWANQKSMALIMANLCLLLKCFLSLVIAWLLTTRHLIFYMEKVYATRSGLETARNGFRTQAITIVKSAGAQPGE